MGVKLREKSGRWYTVIWDQGKRTSRAHASKREAETIAKELRLALARKGYSLPSPLAPTFKQCAEDFLARHGAVRTIRPATIENYGSFIREHLIPAFGALKMHEVTPERVEAFIAAKQQPGASARFKDRGLAPSSLRVGLAALRLICGRALRDKWITSNPVTDLGSGVLPRKDEEARETVDPFTTAELRAILTAAETIDPDWATLIRMWVQSGARRGEVLGLQVRDLDMVAGMVKIQRTYSRRRLGPPKRNGARTVSFLNPITEATREWRPGLSPESRAVLHGLRRLKVTGLTPESFVFGGAEPMSRSLIESRWRRTLKAAGVRYRWPEQLRHTCASTLLSRNAPLLFVQKQGGWKSAAVLLRVYATWIEEAAMSTEAPAPQARLEVGGGQTNSL